MANYNINAFPQQQQHQLSLPAQFSQSMGHPLAGQRSTMPARAPMAPSVGNPGHALAAPFPHPPAPTTTTQIPGPHLQLFLSKLRHTFHPTTISLSLTHNSSSFTLNFTLLGLLQSHHHPSSPAIPHYTQHNLSRMGQSTFQHFNAPVTHQALTALTHVLENPGSETTVYGWRMVQTALAALWYEGEGAAGELQVSQQQSGVGRLVVWGLQPKFDPEGLEMGAVVQREFSRRFLWDERGFLVLAEFEREFLAQQQQRQQQMGALAVAPPVPERTMALQGMPAAQPEQNPESASRGGQEAAFPLLPASTPAREVEQTALSSRKVSPSPPAFDALPTSDPLPPAEEEDDTCLHPSLDLELELFGEAEEEKEALLPAAVPHLHLALPPKRKRSPSPAAEPSPKRPCLSLSLPPLRRASPAPSPAAAAQPAQQPQRRGKFLTKEQGSLSLSTVQNWRNVSKFRKDQLQDFLKRGPREWGKGMWIKRFGKEDLVERIEELGRSGELERWAEVGEGREFVRKEGVEGEKKKSGGGSSTRKDSGLGGEEIHAAAAFSAGPHSQNGPRTTPAVSTPSTFWRAGGATAQDPVRLDSPLPSQRSSPSTSPPASSTPPTSTGATPQDPLDVDDLPPLPQKQLQKKNKKTTAPLMNADFFERWPELRPKLGVPGARQEFCDVPVPPSVPQEISAAAAAAPKQKEKKKRAPRKAKQAEQVIVVDDSPAPPASQPPHSSSPTASPSQPPTSPPSLQIPGTGHETAEDFSDPSQETLNEFARLENEDAETAARLERESRGDFGELILVEEEEEEVSSSSKKGLYVRTFFGGLEKLAPEEPEEEEEGDFLFDDGEDDADGEDVGMLDSGAVQEMEMEEDDDDLASYFGSDDDDDEEETVEVEVQEEEEEEADNDLAALIMAELETGGEESEAESEAE